MNKSLDTGLGTAIDRAVPLKPRTVNRPTIGVSMSDIDAMGTDTSLARVAIRGERFDGTKTATALVPRGELGEYVDALLDLPNVMNVEVMKDF